MDERIINNIKSIACEMVNKAGSGHTGIILSAAPILYTLFSKHLVVDVKNDKWINRDRFIMSAGHGSALLYTMLYYSGYNISIDDLKRFRQIDSITPGHPELNLTPGVDISTGPLGQGIASAVGIALASKILGERYILPKMGSTNDGESIFDYHVYVLCGDGDLMEGISYEATSLAGNLNLDNLIILYDSNNISLDGDTSNTFTENVIDRFKALGWHTELVRNGTDIKEIDNAIKRSKEALKPSLIEIKTTIGLGTKYEGTSKIHGIPLNNEELSDLKKSLNIKEEEFYVDLEALNEYRKAFSLRNKAITSKWLSNYNNYINLYLNGDNKFFDYLKFQDKSFNLDNTLFPPYEKKALRDLNSMVISEIAKNVPNFLGGSADLASSTKTYLKEFSDIKDNHYDGRNIWFGVREHAMGAILNGLSASGFRVFGSTFLPFADYIKPAIRMSAIMNLPVTYIFTHDNITIGEDGPTHQAVEELTMLRSTPNLDVFRPADLEELIGAWNYILKNNHPSALVLSKQEFNPIKTTNRVLVEKGAYIVRKEVSRLNGIIVSSGSEVHLALELANKLYEKGLDIRVVSMPNTNLFLFQDKEYYNKVLPIGTKVIALEYASSYSWYRFVYNESYLITLDKFGMSGKKDDVLKKYNLDYESVEKRVISLLK